ncbi:Sodium/hydrogen exchanger family-domain-containing protein [Dactylonectria estremocensis]|uniref:Sodium/hydrogen exchanger family-domain-containing protein n=1 Tax=Dactylonectria estremocensis TaxID=1079267 RepID=A0A9P9J162_9HYPO|nr:Sodium/hydrogen exchanger family-domain-containing protein [Dactylonectria estremocensis]
MSSTGTGTASAATATAVVAKAASQGGIFEGLNPTVYNPADPIVLFIIQATIVISLTRLLYWPLGKIREPRVIAEVITGIILGPSVMGRIPGFTDTIFPKEGMAPFRLAANIGLILYLFLVGMEINLLYLLRNWRTAIGVATLDMAIPFGCGVALAYGLYNEFGDDPELAPISFAVFALFIGIAIAITAFPVLCRILTALKLLNTNVGVIVLTSGIINDVVGWILLALCVTLVNSGAGVTTVWILLTAVGYALFLSYAVRPVFMWVLRKTHSLENGPTEGVVALTILMVFASAFFTSIIGVHSIFGAFMVGLMCPHEGGFAIKLTEKIEDIISTLFVPLFFALSGINTNLSLLDSGIIWGYVVAVIFTAFFSKLFGGTMGARLNGLVWRESVTIGTLMSCKGLVELIVLNIGLQAKILSTRTFTIFVVMALVTTFATAPLTSWLYPSSYQRKLELWKQGKIDWEGNALVPGDEDHHYSNDEKEVATRLLVYLRTDGLSSIFSTLSLFTSGQSSSGSRSSATQSPSEKEAAHPALVGPFQSEEQPQSLLRIHGCRLVGLSERNSSVMKVSEIEEYAGHDPIIKAFGTSANNTSRDVVASGQIAVVPEDSFADTLATEATKLESDLILVPWSETGTISELPSFYSASRGDPLANGDFALLMSNIFTQARSVAAVGLFVDSTLLDPTDTEIGAGPRQLSRQISGMSRSEAQDPSTVKFHSAESRKKKVIRVLYSGSADDVYAVRLALQFAQNEHVNVEIVSLEDNQNHLDMQFARIKASVPEGVSDRVTFTEIPGETTSIAANLLSSQPQDKQSTTFILGRSVPSVGNDASGSSSGNIRNTLGSVAASLTEEIKKTASSNMSLLVVQARHVATDRPSVKRKASVYSHVTAD